MALIGAPLLRLFAYSPAVTEDRGLRIPAMHLFDELLCDHLHPVCRWMPGRRGRPSSDGESSRAAFDSNRCTSARDSGGGASLVALLRNHSTSSPPRRLASGPTRHPLRLVGRWIGQVAPTDGDAEYQPMAAAGFSRG